MPAIKSLDDLKRIREETLAKQKAKRTSGSAQVIVGMGTCGIAAGARDTMEAILKQIEEDRLSGIQVTQTGCIGLCEAEPIVQVILGEQQKISYGKVTPEVVERILKEHVQGGKIVQDHVIEV